jgi:alkylated DNA repair protein (DNA oxidative demethylase)
LAAGVKRMFQPELFDRPIVPGLRFRPDIVTSEAERDLIARIDAVDLTPFRFQGWIGKRVTASFGWRYDFEDASFAPTEPLPAWLLPFRETAAAFAGLPASEFVQALLTRYDAGAGIGWHRDRSVFEHVVGISLGEPATMRFRRRKPGGFERAKILLPPRSIYHLSGEVRHDWEHGIPEMDVTRWSITFRSLSAKGLAAVPIEQPRKA